MKHPLPPLESLKVFEAAARHLSFNLAADELCITKGAVSYQIRKLEESIDCALFKRSVRQVYLTDAGQKLLQTTQRIFVDMEKTLIQLSQTDREQTVIVAATTYVALRWLSSRVAQFNQCYPDVSIVFTHSVNSDDFKITDADIALRWGRCDQRRDRSRLLELPMPLFPVCSPGLLRKFGFSNLTKQKLSSKDFVSQPLDSIPLLCEDRRLDLWQQWHGNPNTLLSNPRRIITDANVRTQAAIDGQGWTMADALMQQELDDGKLIAPFNHQLQGYGYVLMASSGRHMNNKVSILRDWLMSDAQFWIDNQKGKTILDKKHSLHGMKES